MKKLRNLMIVAMVLATVCSLNAQQKKSLAVPANVKTAFAKAHPKLTKVKWERENSAYEAGFMHNGHETSELYDASGKMTEMEVAIKVADLPKPVRDYVTKNHKGEKIKEAAKITKSNGEVNYEAEVKGMDLIFNAKGDYLKQSKE
jgi:hypothetical protein